jgi:hypothetical protein
VTLKDTGAGVVIHYTTDGTTPLITSPTYSVAIHLTATKTIKAIAFGPVGWLNSALASGVYTIQ